MPADIVVRIGAAQDRSVDVVFADIEKRAKRAGTATRRESQITANAERTIGSQRIKDTQLTANQQLALEKWRAGQELKVERDKYREQSRINRQILAERVKMDRAMARESAKLSRQRTRDRLRAISEEERAEAQHQQRLLRMKIQAQLAANRNQRAADRAALRDKQKSDREWAHTVDRFATRTSHRATRFFFPRPEGALGYARRLGTDLLRGVGLDTSFGGGVSRAVQLESAAQTLSQNAFQPGAEGPAGKQVAAQDLIKGARKAASMYGLKGGSQEVIEGQSKFVSVTGDLQTARDLTQDMAKLSSATGANFTDVMEASAAISNKLGEVPDKGKKIYELMRGFAWQGKLGAVEISDMAKTMPRLLSGVTRFEGDIGTNMMKMGAFAQMARGGPASSAAEAATGVARMADLFVTKTRVKALKQTTGMTNADIFTKEGLVRDPLEIIKKGLERTKGDTMKMKTAFNSIMGNRPIERITDLYRKAGGGKAGLAAADAEMKRLMSGTDVGMSEEVVKKLAEQQAETKEAKAAKFQENLDKITSSVADRLLPVMEKLAPAALGAADKLGRIASWSAENPWKAASATAALTGLRAALESGVRGALERTIKDIGANKSVSAAFSTTGGKIANSLNMLALATATFTITSAMIKAADVSLQEEKKERAEAYNETYQKLVKGYTDAATPEEREKSVQEARKKIGEIHQSRGDFLNAVSEDEDQKKTMAAVSEFVKNYRVEKPWKPFTGDLAPATAPEKQEVSNEEAAHHMESALKRTEVRISGWDSFISLLSRLTPGAGSGGMMSAPYTANQVKW